jgi:hypothetical protein
MKEKTFPVTLKTSAVGSTTRTGWCKSNLGQQVTVLTCPPLALGPAVAQARLNPAGQSAAVVVYRAFMVKDGGRQVPVGVLPVNTGVGVPYMLLK